MTDSPTPDCTACGTCCRKGGPVLHGEDARLVEQQILPLAVLVTLRVGELTFDPVTSQLLPLEEEVIKVAGSGAELAPWHCVLLEGESHCRIYADRPAQCRSLFCKDTSALEKLYTQRRLTRADILGLPHVPAGWLDLALAHEEDCNLLNLVPLARQVQQQVTGSAAAEQLLEALRFDTAFRELCIEKAHVPAEALPCLLGRPLADFLSSFGLGVVSGKVARTGVRVYP